MSDEPQSSENDPIAIAFGSRLLQERERLGLTKEALAARAGLSSRYVWRVESGRINVQLRNLSRFAAGLDLTVSELTAGLEQLVAEPLNRPKPKRRGPLPRTKSPGG